MGMLQTNEVPFNPSVHPDWKTKTSAVVDEPELPGERTYQLLLNSSSGVYFWDGTHLYRFLCFQGKSVLVKDIETGAPGVIAIVGHATRSRLMKDDFWIQHLPMIAPNPD